mgnify:CR=1 FL=1
METKNDNFEQLKAGLFQSIRDARTNRTATYTDGGVLSEHGGRVSVDKGDEDGATVRVVIRRASLSFLCQPEDLRAIAAQCLAAAEEVEEAIAEAQAVRPNTTHA